MDRFLPDLDRLSTGSNLSSLDDFDLASLGLGLPPQEEPQEEEPTINPLHDMDSLDFHLWMEEEVEKEARRRRGEE